jgi:hypothetical protein
MDAGHGFRSVLLDGLAATQRVLKINCDLADPRRIIFWAAGEGLG